MATPSLTHFHSLNTDEDNCPECGGHTYEIKIRPASRDWASVTAYIFRSWTGARRLDGKNYNGPVYFLGTENLA